MACSPRVPLARLCYHNKRIVTLPTVLFQRGIVLSPAPDKLPGRRIHIDLKDSTVNSHLAIQSSQRLFEQTGPSQNKQAAHLFCHSLKSHTNRGKKNNNKKREEEKKSFTSFKNPPNAFRSVESWCENFYLSHLKVTTEVEEIMQVLTTTLEQKENKVEAV